MTARLLAFLALVVVAGSAHAQTYPAREIRILIGFTAGGTTDILGRLIANEMSKSFGVPVIASAAGGIVDIVIDGETGLLVPPADASKLAEALERIARDGSFGERLGATGKRFVAERFAWPVIVRQWRSVYTRAITPNV